MFTLIYLFPFFDLQYLEFKSPIIRLNKYSHFDLLATLNRSAYSIVESYCFFDDTQVHYELILFKSRIDRILNPFFKCAACCQLQWRSRLAHGTYMTVTYEECRGREFEPRLEQLFCQRVL